MPRSTQQNEGLRPEWAWRRVLVSITAIVVVVGAAIWLWPHLLGGGAREKALALAQAQRFDEAEPTLIRLFESDPNDLTVVIALATGYVSSDRLVAGAEPYLTRWCELEPANVTPFKLRMDLSLRLKHSDRALPDGLHVLEREPENFELRKTVAWLLLGQGRFAEAEDACRLCLRSHPDSPPLRFLQASIESMQGHTEPAIRLLDPLVTPSPPYPPAALLRAALYLEDQPPLPDKAVPLLRAVLATNLDTDDRQKARYLLSQALFRLKEDAEATRVLDELRRDREAERLFIDSQQQLGNEAMQMRAAAALLDVGRSEQGLDLVQRVLRRDANNAAAHRVLADYYQKLGQKDRASFHRRLANPEAAP
jgi:tetratricopeptide (TPR) repeat protein